MLLMKKLKLKLAKCWTLYGFAVHEAAIPVIPGANPSRTFAGANETYSIEAMMGW